MIFRTRVTVLGAACLVGMMFLCVRGDHYTLDYTCLPNEDIEVINPDVGKLLSATAGTIEHVCNVSVSADTTLFTITGCHKNENIHFTLSTRQGENSTGDGIIGGSYSETYVLLCLELGDEGIIFNASVGIDVQLQMADTNGTNGTTHAPHYSEQPVTPTFTVDTSIWNSDETQQVTSAIVGDLLKWKVDGPYEYDLLPFTCTVNPGSVYGTPPMVTVIENGCSVIDMVTNFEASSGNPVERGSLVSDLYAFKFTMADDLTIACSVKICTRGNETCTASCSGRKRRALKRHVPDDVTGVHANVVSHLTIRESGAVMQGLSYTLLISTCVIALGQNLLYLKI